MTKKERVKRSMFFFIYKTKKYEDHHARKVTKRPLITQRSFRF